MNIHDHPMPTLLLSADGQVRDGNASASSLMGMAEGQLKGAVIERVFLAVDGGPSPERFLGTLLAQGQGRFDGVLMGVSGARHRVTAWGWKPMDMPEYWVHIMPAPAPRAVAAQMHAVSPVQQGDPFKHLPAPFRQVLGQPSRAEALLRLGGAMSTHARELLSTLMKLAHVLRGQPGGHPHLAAFTQVATTLSQDAERLAELTGTAGELAPELLNVGQALTATAVLLEGALPPSIHIAVEAVDPHTSHAWCNPLALQQALLALAHHACQAMPAGGHLLLSALPGAREGTVDVHVRDTGAASILADDEDSSVHRAEAASRGRRGMDLALPLVRDLMDRVGGDVMVASSVSTGTCVVITLPARAEAGKGSGARPRVLVVDDDAELRRVTARLLEQSGMVVHTAADGGEALQQLSSDVAWSGLLLDLHMPRADGADVLRFVQVMPNPPAVVVFTADDIALVKDQLLGLGAYAVMPKPFLGRELVATLRAAMRTRQPV